MQAIVTKFHGPTDSRGSRVSAKAQAGRKFYAWDYALDSEQNHDAAAKAYADSLGWLANGYRLVGGGLPDGTGNCYVLTSDGYRRAATIVRDRRKSLALPKLADKIAEVFAEFFAGTDHTFDEAAFLDACEASK